MKYSPFLKYGVEYNAAKSTCRRWLLVLPKIVQDGSTLTCHCRALWSTVATSQFDFLLDQTLICVTVPEKYQVDDYVLTPVSPDRRIILPVTYVEIRHSWQKPVFKNVENLKRLAQDDDLEKLYKEWDGNG